jgi:hypothetical protein
MDIKKIKYYIIIILSAITLYNCTDVPQGVVTNSPPETYLSLFPDSIISPQVTRIKITWWGDDPDGLVKGYRFSFDSTNWTYSEANDSTFQLVIVGNDSTFRFWVAAVDDKGNIDPSPATNLFPVFNSPPSVAFNAGTNIPDTSFPVATFAWTGTDPDGNNSISKYYWALNDTSAWNELPATTTTLTIRQANGINPGQNNKLYLKVRDIAGIYSPTVRMPDSNRTWFVRPVTGHILLINDYYRPSDIDQAVQFYRNALDTVPFNLYSYLDIKVNNNGNIPKIINPMFIETLKLFQCVIWFANRGLGNNDNANFDLAQQTLPFYLAAGGKVFFTTGFPNSITAQGQIINFAPVDSMTNFVFNVDPGMETIVFDNSYPPLTAGGVQPDRVRGIKYHAGTPVVYKLPFSAPYDTSKYTIAIKDVNINPKVMLLSVPLNRMDGNGNNATIFFRKVLRDLGIN